MITIFAFSDYQSTHHVTLYLEVPRVSSSN